jgi:hypothetical protein
VSWVRESRDGDMSTLVVDSAASELLVWQRHVARLLDVVDRLDGWLVMLPPHERDLLIRRGHFAAYAGELHWSPKEVAGHLRDSALIFTERIRRLRVETEPTLYDFDTTAPTRLADYRTTGTHALVAQLQAAQTTLHSTIMDVTPTELDRLGWHEIDGHLTLRDVLGFLPSHQEDHVRQLEALVTTIS